VERLRRGVGSDPRANNAGSIAAMHRSSGRQLGRGRVLGSQFSSCSHVLSCSFDLKTFGSGHGRIPNKPEFIEPAATLTGKLVLNSTLMAYPTTKIIAVRFIFLRN
jgi:hypothetical protein